MNRVYDIIFTIHKTVDVKSIRPAIYIKYIYRKIINIRVNNKYRLTLGIVYFYKDIVSGLGRTSFRKVNGEYYGISSLKFSGYRRVLCLCYTRYTIVDGVGYIRST